MIVQIGRLHVTLSANGHDGRLPSATIYGGDCDGFYKSLPSEDKHEPWRFGRMVLALVELTQQLGPRAYVIRSFCDSKGSLHVTYWRRPHQVVIEAINQVWRRHESVCAVDHDLRHDFGSYEHAAR